MITPETAVSLHPGGLGFNANTCPKCGDRCGDLINGRCLACEIGWEEKFVGAEDVLTYTCPEHGEYLVLIAQDENGVWLIVDGAAERCPQCGRFGSCLEDDPDTYWNADERAEEDAEEDWLEPSLTAAERNR